MPLVLLNFPKIDLIGYVVQARMFNKNFNALHFRYTDADFLSARAKAIKKALELKEQLYQAAQWNLVDCGRVRLFLEYKQSRPENHEKPTTERLYILDGSLEPCNQMKLLDLEAAYLLGAKKVFPQYEIDCGLLTFVAVYQNLVELLNYYTSEPHLKYA